MQKELEVIQTALEPAIQKLKGVVQSPDFAGFPAFQKDFMLTELSTLQGTYGLIALSLGLRIHADESNPTDEEKDETTAVN